MTAVDTEPLAWDPLNEKYKGDPHAIWKRLRDEQPLYYNEQSTSTPSAASPTSTPSAATPRRSFPRTAPSWR